MAKSAEDYECERRLLQDKRDEIFANMSLAEQVEFEQRTAAVQPVRSSFENLPAVLTRAERTERAAAYRAAREAEAAAPPPDNAALLRLIEELQQRVAILEKAEDQRRDQATHSLYKLRR